MADMTELKITDSGYIRDLTEFLVYLRDEYGFVIDAERIASCMFSAEDVTNIDEVRYRLQAMLCKSEDDIAVFSEQFGKWVQNQRIVPVSEIVNAIAERKKNSAKLNEARQALEKMSRMVEAASTRLKDLEKNRERLEDLLSTRRDAEERFFLSHRAGEFQALIAHKKLIGSIHRAISEASEKESRSERDAILDALEQELREDDPEISEDDRDNAIALVAMLRKQLQDIRNGNEEDIDTDDKIDSIIKQFQQKTLDTLTYRLGTEAANKCFQNAERAIKNIGAPFTKKLINEIENMRKEPETLYYALEQLADEVNQRGRQAAGSGNAKDFRKYAKAVDIILSLRKELLQTAGVAASSAASVNKVMATRTSKEVAELNAAQDDLARYCKELDAKMADAKFRKLVSKAKNYLAALNNGEKLVERLERILTSKQYDTLTQELKLLTSEVLDISARERNSGNTAKFQKALKAAQAMTEVKNGNPIGQSQISKYQKYKNTIVKMQAIASKSQALDDEYVRTIERIQQAKEDASTSQKALEEATEQTESLKQRGEELLIKERSLTHRPDWDGSFLNGRSVMTLSEKAELLEREVETLNHDEQQQVLSYIRDNAMAFKHTMRRQTSSISKRRIDVRATARAAIRTDGIPYVIKYKKPKKSHAKVVFLVDLSGSCRNAASLSLYFMALMNDVFPGGCNKFVFVNSLVPVDDMFRNVSAKDGVQAVFKSVKTRGVYSNYGTPVAQLHDEYGGLISKETTVLIIGDARNNSNLSEKEKFKDICDRSRNVFWLNPDDVAKWNQGDSIIGVYEDAGAKVSHFSCVGELLDFLSSVSKI